MKSYGTLVGELPTGVEFVLEGALLRIYFDFERGIKNLVAGNFTDSAQRLIIGANITTTGVLLRKAEIKEIVGSMRSWALNTVVLP